MRTIYTSLFLLVLVGCIPVRPTERIRFTAPDLYPEGIAWDPAAQVYYVSSARTGAIGRVTPTGDYTVLHADSTLKSTYGMKVHPDGKRLFVCAADANYSRFTAPETRYKMSRLISIDLATGRRLQDIDLSTLFPGEHFANDLTFDPQGNAYLTDSYGDAIIKVDASGKPSVFSRHELFRTAGIGINGIAYHPGGFLLVSSTGTGCLYKVNVNDGNDVRKVRMDMYTVGGDGVLLKDSANLLLVINGGNDKIFRLTSDDGWASAKLTGTTFLTDRYTYPSTATANGDDVWIMNAKFHDLNDTTAIPSKVFAIQKLAIKPIPRKFRQ